MDHTHRWGVHGSTMDRWLAQVESSPDCEHTDAMVNGNSSQRCKEGEWVTTILPVGEKRQRGDGDEPTEVRGSQ
jgi:hypothetical protein